MRDKKSLSLSLSLNHSFSYSLSLSPAPRGDAEEYSLKTTDLVHAFHFTHQKSEAWRNYFAFMSLSPVRVARQKTRLEDWTSSGKSYEAVGTDN